MKIQKAYLFRLYPSKTQKSNLKRFGGGTRRLWNILLEKNITEYETNKKFIFYKDMTVMLPSIKKEYEWLSEIPAMCQQRVAKNLDQAFKTFLKREDKTKGFPNFKKKSDTRDSFYITNQGLKFSENTEGKARRAVYIPKLGWVNIRGGKSPEGKIMSATVSQNGDLWYISIATEIEAEDTFIEPTIEKAVGLDVGLKELCVSSDNFVLPNPKHIKKSEKKIKKQQRSLAKSTKGKNNYKKKQLKLKKTHTKVANQRKDYIHKFTTQITNEYDVICLENLNITGMMQNHCLAGAIGTAGWGEMERQFQYKTEWQNKHFTQIDRYAASSQICSNNCGHRHKMPLKNRTFDCPVCLTSIDRDLNAAINIKNWGFKKVGQEMAEPVNNYLILLDQEVLTNAYGVDDVIRHGRMELFHSYLCLIDHLALK